MGIAVTIILCIIFLPIAAKVFHWISIRFVTKKLGYNPFTNKHLHAASTTSYETVSIMNKSEAALYYKLTNYFEARQQREMVFPQIPMGIYLKTPDDIAHEAIRHKRPDFTVVNSKGYPICVIECQGQGHFQGNYKDRDKIKAAALTSAGIPLIEIFQDEIKQQSAVFDKLNIALSPHQSL